MAKLPDWLDGNHRVDVYEEDHRFKSDDRGGLPDTIKVIGFAVLACILFGLAAKWITH